MRRPNLKDDRCTIGKDEDFVSVRCGDCGDAYLVYVNGKPYCPRRKRRDWGRRAGILRGAMAIAMSECRVEACESDVFADEQCRRHYYRDILTDAVMEDFPRPLNFLLVQLVEHNVDEWIVGKPETQGAENVWETGMTSTQQQWAVTIAEALEDEGENEGLERFRQALEEETPHLFLMECPGGHRYLRPMPLAGGAKINCGFCKETGTHDIVKRFYGETFLQRRLKEAVEATGGGSGE